MKINNRTKVAATIIAGVGVALAMPALPAVGQASPPTATIHIESPGHILDRGAVAQVSVRLVCPAGQQQLASVQLTERSGNGIAQGSGSANITCTGGFQQATVTITPSNKPWVSGTAFAQAQLSFFFCGPFPGCPPQPMDSRSIKLTQQKK